MGHFALRFFVLCCFFSAVSCLTLNEQIELPPFCSGPNKDNAQVLSCCNAVKAFEGSELSESGGMAPQLKECERCGKEMCPNE